VAWIECLQLSNGSKVDDAACSLDSSERCVSYYVM